MTSRKKKYLIGAGVLVLVFFIGLVIAASILSRRFEPYIRQQAINYMSERFDSEVELESLHVNMPKISPLRLLTERHGLVRVDGEGILMRHKGRRDVPPMFAMKKFSFEVDLGVLFAPKKTIRLVTLQGLEINIPPKGERPDFGSDDDDKESSSSDSGVLIERIEITDAKLRILPKQLDKKPLEFDIHNLNLESAGAGVAMTYDASLTNAKPPGEILSKGHLGPWVADEPGDTPLDGGYSFDDADLGVFSSIAGILDSTGQFEGTLSQISVRGEASVPDFRLKMSENPVPLKTKFEVMVDGTNGNTVLQPVVARLGTTDFTTSGAVIKNEGEHKRTITLDVSMPNGNLRDVLKLAMKGPPFMEGNIVLKTSIDIPPLEGKVKEKLRLNGNFQVKQARFLSGGVQDKIDSLSRRAQGEPKNEQIDDVVSAMKGVFNLDNEIIAFKSLSFNVDGADIDLAGTYHFGQEIDLHGTLKLDAKLSQTQTGWKRWVLKPVDPFFAKNGAGTFVRIKIEGTADEPKFGRDSGDKDNKDTKDSKDNKDTKNNNSNKGDKKNQTQAPAKSR